MQFISNAIGDASHGWALGFLRRQFDKPDGKTAVTYFQQSHGGGLVVSGMRGAPGIYKQNSVLGSHPGTMRVSADDSVHSGLLRIDVQPLSIVQHADAHVFERNDIEFGQGGRPRSGVHVSPNSRYRGEAFELCQDARSADISSVDDSFDRLKHYRHCGMKISVRVGDHPDSSSLLRFSSGDHLLCVRFSFRTKFQIRFR